MRIIIETYEKGTHYTDGYKDIENFYSNVYIHEGVATTSGMVINHKEIKYAYEEKERNPLHDVKEYFKMNKIPIIKQKRNPLFEIFDIMQNEIGWTPNGENGMKEYLNLAKEHFNILVEEESDEVTEDTKLHIRFILDFLYAVDLYNIRETT